MLAAALAAALASLGTAPAARAAANLGQISEMATPTAAAEPEGITAGPDGNLWFVEYAADRIGELNPATGAISEWAVPTAQAGPMGIAWGPDGRLWFTEYLAGKIGAIDPVTHAITEYATPTPGSGPVALTAGPGGDMWFTESTVGQIGEIIPATGAITEYPAATRSGEPWAITEGPGGGIWYTEKSAGRIGELDPSAPAQAADYPLPAPAGEPDAIVTGPDGNLWLTESANGSASIAELPPANPASVSQFPLPDTSAQPLDLVAGPDGNIWFTESRTGAIGVIDPVTDVISAFATPTAGSDPIGLAVGQDGNVWFTEGAPSRIGVIGTGATAATAAVPSVTGTPQPGGVLSCTGGSFTQWAGPDPSLSALPFDGYQWLLGGSPLVGADAPTYVTQSYQVGQQLSCEVKATYQLQASTAVATSAPVTVAPPLEATLGRSVSTGASVSVAIACAGATGQSCTGNVTVTARVTRRTAKGSRQSTIETVASAPYSVQASRSAKLELTLNATGRALLARLYRLPAKVALTGTGAAGQAKQVTFSYPVIAAGVGSIWRPSSSFTVAQQLAVWAVPASGSVQAICRGGGCPFGERRFRPVRGSTSLTPSFDHSPLTPGTHLLIEITATGQVGKVVEFTIRPGATPAVAELCLPPGTSTPARCA